MSKLIVIRGNSGSGKSTVAKLLRESSNQRVAIVEQDYLRRFILKEKETESEDNIQLIYQTVSFALDHGYDVILEGILYFPRYQTMLKRLSRLSTESHYFYLDVSLAETLRRHATKVNAHEFGKKQIREWYKPLDVTGFEGEVIILGSSSATATVQTMRQQCGY